MKLSIVIPAHNEEENIREVVQRIEQVVDIPHELVIVNDHSTDKTGVFLQELKGKYQNITVVENTLAAGFANAVKAGFSHTQHEVIIPIMADLCDDLSTLRPMFEKICQGYDVVCGARYIKGGSRVGGSKLKGFFSCWGGRTLHYLMGIPTTDISNAFKMYRKKVIDSIPIESTGFEISMELPLKAFILGYKITEVPTVWRERVKGQSSFKIFKLLPRYLKLYLRALVGRLR
ncbi:MAG: glycosyltransferase family 2 protein [Candidatus Omnitrophica bacterium]|nr:glycosyltransferase family 2 protein [Candidatus Omnitrophota bacterium]